MQQRCKFSLWEAPECKRLRIMFSAIVFDCLCDLSIHVYGYRAKRFPDTDTEQEPGRGGGMTFTSDPFSWMIYNNKSAVRV